MAATGPTLSPPQPLDLPTLVPQLVEFADLEMQALFSLDSGDLQPAHWLVIARAVHAALARDDLSGVVVTHGTDTMAYTASALAFLLGPIPKPVVLTGAQRPISDMRTDARTNVIDAVLGATLEVPEVVIAFGSSICAMRKPSSCSSRKLPCGAFSVRRPTVGL